MADRLIHIPDIKNKTYAVLGLGRSGEATAHALAASGALVWAWDDAEKARARLSPDMIQDLTQCDWSWVEALVMSPGIPHTHPKPHPAVAAAKGAGKPIISDIELLLRACPKARYVGITGTNGKSTTTALIGHVLIEAKRKVAVGGNLGPAALSLAPLGPDGIYVLELSSYQLEITPSPIAEIAILLNITPDHLDRHGGMEGYIAAKKRVMLPKGKSSIGIIGIDDEPSRKLFEELKKAGGRKLIPISAARTVPGGVSASGGRLVDDMRGDGQLVLDLKAAAALPGQHNWQNAAAAYIAVKALGLTLDEIVAGFRNFPGLAHRQELIATLNDIRYVNDSKATNADATAKALACYDEIYWIIGGRAKEGGLADLAPFYPKIRHGYLIGEAAPMFQRQIGRAFPATQCGTLDKAVAAAHAQAQREKRKGAVVLLSPACASWDQFENFEARGDRFRILVKSLVDAVPPARGHA